MRHSVEWQDETTNAVPEEGATVADFRLFLNDRNVTIHVLDGALGDHITVALHGLALGLAHDWWTIFGSRDREFSLREYRAGYLLPDIRFHFDGAVFEVSAHGSAYADPDLRFFGGTTAVMSRAAGEGWLTSLIDDVLARLATRRFDKTGLSQRWARVHASRSRGEQLFCEAAGSLGLDPYRIADEVAGFIEQAESLFDAEPLIEFVSGSAEVDRSRLIEWVHRATRVKGFRHWLPGLRSSVDAVRDAAPAPADRRAYALGYCRARAMRGALDLRQADRFGSFRDLARRFDAPAAFDLAPKVDGINALRREDANGIHVHVRSHGNSSGSRAAHLFALARGIGDAACFPEPATAPINGLHDNAYRQAAGRAFAAELLAPIDEILSMREDARDIYSISDEFGVTPTLIQHQIENRDRIRDACR